VAFPFARRMKTRLPGVAHTLRTNSLPFSGPNRNKVVERPSDAVPVFAITLSEYRVLRHAVFRMMMWPAGRVSEQALRKVCSVVEPAVSAQQLLLDELPWKGSLKCTSHPASPWSPHPKNVLT